MKNFYLLLLALGLVFSCKKKPISKDQQVLLQEGAYAKSAGRPNTLTVVMENHLWEGSLGDVVRKALAASVSGLPQEEPLFTIKQMPATAFSGFVRKSRGFLTFKVGEEKAFTYSENKYARPQIGLHVKGYTPEEVAQNFTEHKEEIIKTFKKLEIQNKQSFIKKTLEIKNLKSKLGYNLRVPNSYRIAKEGEDFFWIRKNIPQGGLNLTLYNVQKSYFKDSLSVVENIIRVRDSIAGNLIPVNEGGRFITEEAFSPFFKKVTLGGLPTFETKGTWEVKNKYMAGPFINYMIDDRENNRFLVLEGFVFAPTITKRDYMLELEAIIKTISFQ